MQIDALRPQLHSFLKKIGFSGISNSPVLENVRIKVTRQEKIFFLDTIGSLIEAGIPVIKALQLLYFQSKKKSIQDLSALLKLEIEKGRNLSEIARTLPQTFSPFDAAMFEMGDATGQIGTIFQTLTNKEEKTLELERKVMGALVYPIAIVGVAFLMITILLIYVIPRIEAIYKEAHTSLPELTTIVIGISHFLRDCGLFLVVGIAALGFGLRIALREKRIRRAVDRGILKIPLFGGLIRAKILVIFSDFLAILLNSGITIYRALDIVGSAIDNTYYQSEIEWLIRDIRAGKHLSLAMGGDYLERRIKGESLEGKEMADAARRLDCFTMELGTAVKVGEQTGTLAAMLAKASKRYEREIDTTVKSLSSLLEPVVIIVIGAIVGVIVLAIMMPFFNMVQVIQ